MKKMNRAPWVLISLCILAVLAGGLLSGADDRGNEGAPHQAVNEAGSETKSVSSPSAPVSADVPQDGKKEDAGPREEEKSPPPGPYVAIVIDDFGFSRSIADEYKDISLSLTWSIIPFQTHSGYAAELAEESGIPYMVHMPMSAVGDKKWSEKKGVIDTGMSAETVTLLLRKAMASLPGALGMNNHRGSRATKDEKIMEMIMTELAATPLFFLDSRTIASSVAYKAALENEVPAAFCSVFIDHESSEEFMEKQFRRGLAIAEKKGWVVMIAHTRSATVDFLKKKSGIPLEKGRYVTMPELIRYTAKK
ncbi:MAG: divergent polysaccharide deacetylase family protein [Synergistales bacterium]|nr:divergent polysaccharide deacetylase family protein [Synergistales bacterium]